MKDYNFSDLNTFFNHFVLKNTFFFGIPHYKRGQPPRSEINISKEKKSAWLFSWRVLAKQASIEHGYNQGRRN